MSVFPNPDNERMLEIELTGSQTLGQVTLLICDESGKIMRTEEFYSGDAQADHTTSLAGLANGNYMIIARTVGGQVSERVAVTQ